MCVQLAVLPLGWTRDTRARSRSLYRSKHKIHNNKLASTIFKQTNVNNKQHTQTIQTQTLSLYRSLSLSHTFADFLRLSQLLTFSQFLSFSQLS